MGNIFMSIRNVIVTLKWHLSWQVRMYSVLPELLVLYFVGSTCVLSASGHVKRKTNQDKSGLFCISVKYRVFYIVNNDP